MTLFIIANQSIIVILYENATYSLKLNVKIVHLYISIVMKEALYIIMSTVIMKCPKAQLGQHLLHYLASFQRWKLQNAKISLHET